MRSVDDWFERYGADHQHPTNRLLHWICVPAILWAVIAALWLVPVAPWIGRPGFWCGLVMVGAFSFYWRLSRPVALAMLLVFVAFGLVTEGLYRGIGPRALAWLAGGVFVAAWTGQFIGHAIEGRRPSFLTDLAYLLIGPAWLAGKVLRALGRSW
jgi:uncharacterized membrane protein YGL010W